MSAFSLLPLAVMIHPQFDRVAVYLGKFELYWYGLMYLLAFAFAYGLAYYRTKSRADWHPDMVSDMIFYGAMGVILGGRIGYILFYEFGDFLQNPAVLFHIRDGGMSFHGGFMGWQCGTLPINTKKMYLMC